MAEFLPPSPPPPPASTPRRRQFAITKAADPALGEIIAAVGPFAMQLKSSRSLFGALAEAIVYQQLFEQGAPQRSTAGSRHCSRARKLASRRGTFSARPTRASRGCGLPRARCWRCRTWHAGFRRGALPVLDEAAALADAELIERLVTVRGIGRWSAEMFLMFRLGRPDVLPLDDYSLRKAYMKAFRKRTLPSPQALEKYGEEVAALPDCGELVSVADPGTAAEVK